ncbi:MAG TPA: hypothetical protein VGO68_20670 [Pyrinomonadaceae bacterium]|jgi:hypothetical protein|nr:hypothetical protein [Pyrinomonadaceae bacterium]
MITNTCNGRFLALTLSLAFLAGLTQLALPTTRAEGGMGELTVTGMVKVNGKPAATGDIVTSGSGVETAKGSSAVVSLGKLGRVEALPETKMHVRWNDTSISVVLEAGSVRVATGEGITATITRSN